MRIAVASDIHLEFGGRDFDLPEADVLVLAGDILVIDDLRDVWDYTVIGFDTRTFLREVSVAYKNVVYIPGNHEYYSGNIDTLCKVLNDYLKSEGITNIHFGSTGVLKIEDVTFISATLWTDINKANPVDVNSDMMNDYRQIMCFDPDTKSGGRYLQPFDTMAIHANHKEFITKNLLDAGDKVVVVTHHAPNMLSSQSTNVGSMDYYYCCTDMDDLILDNPAIKYWIHGHLHTRKSYMIGDTEVISNCRGYSGHEKASKTFEIKVIDV